jgi:N-acetylglucosamine kinase-like BadF-type ATPase
VSRPLFVGVDGGGTRTRAVVLDAAGGEAARVVGPAGIVRPDDPCAAADAVSALTREALRQAGPGQPPPVRPAALCCGLAGAGRDTEREAVRVALLLADVAAQVFVVGDAETALEDAFGPAPGALLIAGTGSIAWARAEDGRMVRVGGWGQLLGDEGSGYQIGLQALRCVARSADGRAPPTALAGALLAATGSGEAGDLIRFAAGATKGEIAALTPAVLQCCLAGDAAACSVRDAAVRALVEQVLAAVRRAGLAAPEVALAGGLLEPGGPLREPVMAALRLAAPAAVVREAPVDAARGAARMALRGARG